MDEAIIAMMLLKKNAPTKNKKMGRFQKLNSTGGGSYVAARFSGQKKTDRLYSDISKKNIVDVRFISKARKKAEL